MQKVHTEVSCEPVTKFSGKLNVKSRSEYETCGDKGEVKKPVVATEKKVTVSESSCDFTSFQGSTSQSKGIKHLRICEEEPKLSTAVITEFGNDEADHTNEIKLDICDRGHDSADLSLIDDDDIRGMATTAELNKGSVHCEREVELRANAV
ncbi:unnamed protein product [Trichobilharzia regenti]|nr:unnamed protein product [Trichobilharzia regenti]